MLLFEDQRTMKIKAFLYGARDGLEGRMGEIPAKIKKSIMPAKLD